MKNILTTLALISIVYTSFAQPNEDKKRDFNFFTGYESRNHTIAPVAGTTLTDFNYCPMQQQFKNNPIDFVGSPAVMSDTAGRYLFSFNGYKIADSTYHIMANGDSLCKPDYQSDEGSFIIQGAITIPKPGSDHIYYIFHHLPTLTTITNDPYAVLKGINITTIDMQLNNGRGAVTSREVKTLRGDTLNSAVMKLCRHANGRDWWLIRPGLRLDKYYRLLISPKGIDSLPAQIMPSPSLDSTYFSNYQEFSPDGSQYAHKIPNRGIFIYNFDRCSGLLSNRRFIPRFSQYFGEVYAGICFSPNSRYLYCNTDTSTIQYDTYAPDIAASAITVGLWDRTTVSPPRNYNTAFLQPFNAPNGKMYIAGPSTTQMWHTIHNPDGAGLSCDLRLHDVLLPTIYYGTVPNFPHFRLGALKGTACDTLNIAAGATVATSAAPLAAATLRGSLFPNPADGSLTLGIDPSDNYTYDDNLPSGYTYTLSDVLGRVLRTESMARERSSISTAALPNGIYYVSVRRQGTVVFSGKVVVQHE